MVVVGRWCETITEKTHPDTSSPCQRNMAHVLAGMKAGAMGSVKLHMQIPELLERLRNCGVFKVL